MATLLFYNACFYIVCMDIERCGIIKIKHLMYEIEDLVDQGCLNPSSGAGAGFK